MCVRVSLTVAHAKIGERKACETIRSSSREQEGAFQANVYSACEVRLPVSFCGRHTVSCECYRAQRSLTCSPNNIICRYHKPSCERKALNTQGQQISWMYDGSKGQRSSHLLHISCLCHEGLIHFFADNKEVHLLMSTEYDATKRRRQWSIETSLH
ncbi:hypothetical protein RRG08_038915 [Elysia crispata]|uniref:Uncharacterized protein n=1 Tax=Elysia crispata TaxID=231223 RepID=A0AAE1CTG0_9GAST|nr:hypothetical protein RRG08_038915 [Elysia crispata]